MLEQGQWRLGVIMAPCCVEVCLLTEHSLNGLSLLLGFSFWFGPRQSTALGCHDEDCNAHGQG